MVDRIKNLIDKYSLLYNIAKPVVKETLVESKSNNIVSVINDVNKYSTRKKQKNNKSGITGVCYESKQNRWKAYITRDGISRLKHFGNEFEAIEWRKKQEEYYINYGRFKIIYDI